MKYFLNTIRTYSYWKYALFSLEGIVRVFAILGAMYLFVEMLDFFGVYTRDKYYKYAVLFLILPAIFISLYTRRPISRITYKVPKRDFSIEVVIGDLLDTRCPNIVISSATTFDTDMSHGLISPASLQGQMAHRFFNSNTAEIDKQLDESLKDTRAYDHPKGPGKKMRYPMGTVAKVTGHGKMFFFVAMAELNENGNAQSSVQGIDAALEGLWSFIAKNGELGDIAIPVMGTGRGRVQLSRKKMIARIADSFADASIESVFSNRLVIYIHPGDAEKHNMSLFEIRDYVAQSLHV